MHDVMVTWPERRAVRLLRVGGEESEALVGHEGVWPPHDVYSAVPRRLERKTMYSYVLPTSQWGGAGVLVLQYLYSETMYFGRRPSLSESHPGRLKLVDFRGAQDL